jgi:hypothetical protein
MEGWGAVMHSHGKREVSLQLTPTATTNTNLLEKLGTSVPARDLFIPTDAEHVSINQHTSRRYSGSKHLSPSCTLAARELAFRFPNFSGSGQELDEPFLETHGLIANSSSPLRRKWYLPRPAVHSKCSQHLGRRTKPLPRFLRLGNHFISSRSNPRPSRSPNSLPSVCPSRHCYPKCFELLLPKRHRNARSSRPLPASIRRLDSVAFQHGSHTRYSHTCASGNQPSAPSSSAVRRRRHYPRLAGPAF